MRELGLLRCVDPSSRRFRFVVGPKATLPAEIVLYACADFLARTDSSARTATVSRLATEAGAPGRVFKLSESDLVALLETAVQTTHLTKIARPAGAVQLAFKKEPAEVASDALRGFYQRRKLGNGPHDGLVAGNEADEPSAQQRESMTK